jgi:hypothetical protein
VVHAYRHSIEKLVKKIRDLPETGAR